MHVKQSDLQQQLILSQIPLSNILDGLREIVREEIKAEKERDLQEKFLSPAETAKLFHPPISKVTLSAWTKEGLLKDFRISGRVYYKYSEIIGAVKHLSRYKKGGNYDAT